MKALFWNKVHSVRRLQFFFTGSEIFTFHQCSYLLTVLFAIKKMKKKSKGENTTKISFFSSFILPFPPFLLPSFFPSLPPSLPPTIYSSIHLSISSQGYFFSIPFTLGLSLPQPTFPQKSCEIILPDFKLKFF